MGTFDRRRTANRNPELTADLRRIIGRYAQGDPVRDGVKLCEPGQIELRFYPSPGKPGWTGNNGKVCYATAYEARAAADAINELPGADHVQPYRCPRGDHYHHVDQGRARRTASDIIHTIADAARRGR